METKLKENPTLSDLQAHIKAVCAARGWDKNSHLEIFLLFMEEIGELANGIRKVSKLHTQKTIVEAEEKENLEGEFADVLNYLLDLANYFDVDLEKAFRNKDERNKNRHWKS
jgi:NTP pyrophosphatase (non-canonical NTP hydrolase)